MVDPLIKYIKQLNTHNKITLFVEDKYVELIEFMENIDYFYQIPSKGNKYLIFTLFGLKYRKNKYDISIAAKTGVGSANGFFPYMLGAKNQISYEAHQAIFRRIQAGGGTTAEKAKKYMAALDRYLNNRKKKK